MLTLVKNIFGWFIIVIFLTVPVVLLAIFKYFIILIAKFKNPSLHSFEISDSMTISDSFYEKPLLSIGAVLQLDGHISILELRKLFVDNLLFTQEGKIIDNHSKLFSTIEFFCGYAFKKILPLKKEDFNEIIYESIESAASLNDFTNKFFYEPYEKNKPLWRVVLFQFKENQEANQNYKSFICLKFHHAFADGLSLIYMLEKLSSKNFDKNEAAIKSNLVSSSLCEKVSCLFNAPSALQDFGNSLKNAPNPFPVSGNSISGSLSFLSLDLTKVKKIKKETNTHVISVILTVFGGVIRRILTELKGRSLEELPEFIYIAHTLPWPRGPNDKLCNQWTVGTFKVGLKSENVLERLRETEKDFLDFHKKGISKIMKLLFVPILSLLPLAITSKFSNSETSISTSFPALLTKSHAILEREVEHIWPFIGFTSSRMGIISPALSHSNKIDITLQLNKEIEADLAKIEQISSYFEQELNVLYNEAIKDLPA